MAENGPEVILALYNQNFPLHTTTFDYIKYHDNENLDAYQSAVNDGYFNIIETENNEAERSERYEEINSQIQKGLQSNYYLTYSDENYLVYSRKY